MAARSVSIRATEAAWRVGTAWVFTRVSQSVNCEVTSVGEVNV